MVVFLVESDNSSLDYKIRDFLKENLYDSQRVKLIDIYSVEGSSPHNIRTFFQEHTSYLKPGEYMFFYRNDGYGGWKDEHILLKRCDLTGRLGTVFQEGEHVSDTIMEIADLTDYERIQDINRK